LTSTLGTLNFIKNKNSIEIKILSTKRRSAKNKNALKITKYTSLVYLFNI